MAVAKSYENKTIVGEPFMQDGKMYVRVTGICSRCGGSGNYSYNPLHGTTCFKCGGSGKESMVVRWYTDAQRAAMDRAAEKRQAAKTIKQEARRIKYSARNALGFGDVGYITLFKGDSKVINDWAHETSPCRVRYNTLFQWFCPSWLEMPKEIPDDIIPVKLTWDEVRDTSDDENLKIKSDDEVKKIVNTLIGEPSASEYQGNVGDWLEKDIKVVNNILVESNYGPTRLHIMEDANKNVYVWSTSSKNLEIGTSGIMRMKVKDHRDYNGVKQTLVYYCKMKG